MTIGGKFAALNLLEENIENLTESIHGALVDNSSEVLGKARKKKKSWMTNGFNQILPMTQVSQPSHSPSEEY